MVQVKEGRLDQAEKEVRKAMGLQVNKDLGSTLHLPNHTEWVLTSQAYINIITDVIADTAFQGKECTTKLLVAKPFQILDAVKKKIDLIEMLQIKEAEGATGPVKEVKVIIQKVIEEKVITKVINDTSVAEEGATGPGQPTRSGKTKGSKEKVKEEKVITMEITMAVEEVPLAGAVKKKGKAVINDEQ